MIKNKEVPVGVKIISILYYLLAIFSIFFTIGIIAKYEFIGLYAIFFTIFFIISSAVAGLEFFSFIGLPNFINTLIIAILTFFVGWGLWRVQNWTRIVAIILVSLSFLISIINVFIGDPNILDLIISGLAFGIIWGYLFFNKKVREVFA